MLFRNLGVLGKRFARLFLPSKIAGLQLWLDATDTDTINSKMGADFVAVNSEYLSSASTDFDKGDEDFSFGGWFKKPTTAGTRGFLGKLGTSGNYSYDLWFSSNNLYLNISSNGSSVTQKKIKDSVDLNQWNFAVFVYDSVNDIVKGSYNGGDFVTASHSGGAYASSTADFKIGSQQTGNYFDGQIDGAFFLDRALPLQDVKSMYALGNGVSYNAFINSLNGETYALGQSFDGSVDAFNVNTLLTPLATTTTGTWACWFKPTLASNTENIISFAEASAVELINIINIAGKFRAIVFNGGVVQWELFTDDVVFSDGVWTHVALVQDGVNPVLYVNGVAVAQTFTQSVDNSYWFNDLSGLDNGRIGCINYNSDGNGFFADGIIDEVVIWDRVLTGAELLSIKDKAITDYSASELTNLVAHYAMNNVEGANQVDSIGAYNATPIGAPVTTTGQIVDTTVSNIETDLVSYWELNELSGTRFDEHGSNNLVDNNTVGYALGHIQEPADNGDYVWRWTDKSDNAFNIDQNTAVDQGEYISPVGQVSLDGVSDFYNIDSVLTPLASTTTGTMAFWLKPTSLFSGERVLSFGDTDAETHLDIQTRTGGEVRFVLEKTASNLILLTTDASQMSNGTWTHIAITQDGTSGAPIFYINGVAVASTDTGTGTGNEWFNDVANLDNGRLGCLNFNAGGDITFFNGSIAEPLIYDTNLTSAQILQIYNYNKNLYV